MSSIANPFVHLKRMPEETDSCLTGKGNVNPSSFLFDGSSNSSPSLSRKRSNADAMKSKRPYMQGKKDQTSFVP